MLGSVLAGGVQPDQASLRAMRRDTVAFGGSGDVCRHMVRRVRYGLVWRVRLGAAMLRLVE